MMLRRLFELAALSAMLAVATGGFRGGSGEGGGGVRARKGIPNNQFHPFSDADYLARDRIQVKDAIGVTIILRKSSQTSLNAIAFLDSVRNGLIHPDSLVADIKLGICVDAESTKAVRQGTHLTIPEVQAIDANPSYEIMFTTGGGDRLGGKGVNTVRPSYGGVTGLSGDYVEAIVHGFQVWARDTAKIENPTSWAWGDDRYMAGTMHTMRENGIYQAFGRSREVNAVRSHHDVTETYPEDGYSSWQFPVLMVSAGSERWVGYHGVGENIPDYNLGCRVWNRNASGADPGGVTDTLRANTDLAAKSFSMLAIIVDGEIDDTPATDQDMSYAAFREYIFFLCHRIDEWGMQSFTPEELATRKRGIRTGQLIPHRDFTVPSNDTDYTNGGIASNLQLFFVTGGPAAAPCKMPLGFSEASQHYSSTVDIPNPPGTALQTGANSRPTVWHPPTDGDSVTAGFSATDSTWGNASPSGNVIVSPMHDATRGRPFSFPIVTMGCDVEAVRIAVQLMVWSPVTFSVDDTLYVSYKYGQFAERWDDHMDEGPSSEQIGPGVLLRFAATPALPDTAVLADSLIHKERIEPQFLGWILAATDTTSTGTISVMMDAAAGKVNWMKRLLSKGTFELRPSMITSARTQEYDHRNTLGNPNSLTTPAVSTHEPFYQDMTLIVRQRRIYTSTATVEINARTDRIWGMFCLENLSGSLSAAANVAIMDISAEPAY